VLTDSVVGDAVDDEAAVVDGGALDCAAALHAVAVSASNVTRLATVLVPAMTPHGRRAGTADPVKRYTSRSHTDHGADWFRRQNCWPGSRPELLRLAKRGTNNNCQCSEHAVHRRRLIHQVAPVTHREPRGRTGPIHRSPAPEAGDDGGKDR
jgi:hypothetical protein